MSDIVRGTLAEPCPGSPSSAAGPARGNTSTDRPLGAPGQRYSRQEPLVRARLLAMANQTARDCRDDDPVA